MPRKVCIVSTGNLASNPRVLKEADALHEAGYRVTAVVCDYTASLRSFDDDIAAPSAIATIRPAEFNELLAPETDATGATVATLHKDLGLIEKFHLKFRPSNGVSAKQKGNGLAPFPLQTCGREWLRRSQTGA